MEIRPIDANALHRQVFEDNCGDLSKKENVAQILLRIEKAPTIAVGAQPVKRGKWVETEPDEEDRKIGIDFRIECSECHNENSHITTNDSHEITGKVFWKSKFCPNCGAKMRR